MNFAVLNEGVMRILLILILAISDSAWARPESVLESTLKTSQSSCPSIHNSLEDEANFYLINLIGKKENRETYEGYAKKRSLKPEDVYAKFSATGTFRCGGLVGSANVVLKNNLLALTAHQFLKKGTCEKKSDNVLADCEFETVVPKGQKPAVYKIKPETLKLGTSCYKGEDSANDWAVVELAESVAGVRPYNIANVKDLGSEDNDYEELVGKKTTVIAANADNFKPHPLDTSSLCDGEIGGIQSQIFSPHPKAYFIAFGCSTGGGSSGGGIALRSSSHTPTLIGIIAGDHGTNGLEFGPNNFNDGPLIEGRFYEELISRTK